jgi:hypothetical protein
MRSSPRVASTAEHRPLFSGVITVGACEDLGRASPCAQVLPLALDRARVVHSRIAAYKLSRKSLAEGTTEPRLFDVRAFDVGVRRPSSRRSARATWGQARRPSRRARLASRLQFALPAAEEAAMPSALDNCRAVMKAAVSALQSSEFLRVANPSNTGLRVLDDNLPTFRIVAGFRPCTFHGEGAKESSYISG